MTKQELFRQLYPQQVTYLQKLINSGKMHHAYAFVGVPEGAQDALAFHYVTSLLGEEYPLAQHPDFLRIVAQNDKQSLGVQEAQQAREHLLRRPVLGSYRVILIQDVDRLTIAGANALLKMLEEPPTFGIILCTTAFVQRLPKTVCSRMQFVHLPPVSTTQTLQVLQQSPIEDLTVQEASEIVQGKFERLYTLSARTDASAPLCEERQFWHAFLCATVAQRDQIIQRYLGRGDRAKEAAHTLVSVLDTLESLLQAALESYARQQMVQQPFTAASRWLLPQYSLIDLSKHLVTIRRSKEMATHNVSKKMLFDYLTFAL